MGEYVTRMVELFREVRRVLRDDGTLWLNLGDSYSAGGGNTYGGFNERFHGIRYEGDKQAQTAKHFKKINAVGIAPKNLCGIPWRVAFALQADGWYLRSDIIWSKPNPMPESVTDRPTKAHEYLFLMAKSEEYFYDAEAVKEPFSESYLNDSRHERGSTEENVKNGYAEAKAQNPKQVHRLFNKQLGTGRNRRTVWTITTKPFPEAHFATFPPDLVKPCILAGTSEKGSCSACGEPFDRLLERFDTGKRQKMADGWDTGDGGHGTIHRNGREKGEAGKPVMAARTVGWRPQCDCKASSKPAIVLDPFIGSGTVGVVAANLGRDFLGIELNPEYIEIAERRIKKEMAQGKLKI